MHTNISTVADRSYLLPSEGEGGAKRRVRAAFTLIELLTVIAIIAILAAILFPVFAAVRENARASTTLSNMHQISVAMGQFQLDNHKYPDVLFGYVYRGGKDGGAVVPMDKALEQCEADYRNALNSNATGPALENVDPKNYFPGLYPEYIKDASVFFDPNNPDTDKTLVASTGDGATPPDINVLCPSANSACTGKPAGTLVKAAFTTADGAIFPHEFYVVDALDISPQVDGTKQNALVRGSKTFVYVPRYQSSWSTVQDALNCDNTPGSPMCFDTGTKDASNNEIIRNDYLRQLRWRNPPANTYVTAVTYHVPYNDKVLVLWDSGSAKKVDSATSWINTSSPPSDASTVAVNGATGVSQANFWRITPDAH